MKMSSQKPTCNCRKPIEYPLQGQCLKESVIYQATVTEGECKETYIGLTKNAVKERYNGHKTTFKHANKRNSTEISKHIWSLKDQKHNNYKIEWNIICEAKAYNNCTKKCQLCILEKFHIICRPELGTLNKPNELASGCRHKSAFLYKNLKT